MNRRRLTWIIHNALMIPFIPIRALVLAIYKIGCAAEWIGLRLPGLRRFDGWRGY